MSDVVMRQGNTRPLLDVTLNDRNGAVDLTGEVVRFVMRSSDNSVISDQTSTGSRVSILTSGTSGGVRYIWDDVDTATPGNYLAEYETYPSGSSSQFLTYPNVGHLEIVVTQELST